MLDQWQIGNDYDAAHQFDYPHNEVGVDLPGGRTGRIDGYDPGRAIVERKFSQLSKISEKSARRYLSQLSEYKGATIARRSGQVPETLRGARLEGQLVLEVPRQNAPLPRALLDYADELNIVIRDVYGTVYE